MVAEIIDGTAVARKIRAGIKDEIKRKQEDNKRLRPALTIIQGERFSPLSLRELLPSPLCWDCIICGLTGICLPNGGLSGARLLTLFLIFSWR